MQWDSARLVDGFSCFNHDRPIAFEGERVRIERAELLDQMCVADEHQRHIPAVARLDPHRTADVGP